MCSNSSSIILEAEGWDWRIGLQLKVEDSF